MTTPKESEKMIEILCDGVVHYRRPNDHEDVIAAKELIAKGDTLYTLREVENDDHAQGE